MTNGAKSTTVDQVILSEAYVLGWADATTGMDSSKWLAGRFAQAKATGQPASALTSSKYQYGRICATWAAATGRKLGAPTRRNLSRHAALLEEVVVDGIAPTSRAIIAHMAATALQEICGAIPPRRPMATLTFRHGYPVVPTFAELANRSR